ncbi:MAG: hypothetical protein HHJ10_12105 [Cellulomonas sp.]|uniref:hypothetical protein n=1 Tax=Cellulomonas sp. TaxID=40001 RepID=UPI0017CEF7C4|nr:hypothetical protein [Cellulomonas sp.]NMM31747.1 hypothetical protein [Cellulomonas sp.]
MPKKYDVEFKARAWSWSGPPWAEAMAWWRPSRIYLGDHWLTDVLASIVLSFGITSGVVLLDTWLQRTSRPWLGATEPGASAAGHPRRRPRAH